MGCQQRDSVAIRTRQLSSHHSASRISFGCEADRRSDRGVRVHRVANPGISHQEIGFGHEKQNATAVDNIFGCGVVSVSKTIVRHQASSKRNRTACTTDPQSDGRRLVEPGTLALGSLARTHRRSTSLVSAGKARSLQTPRLAAWAQARLEQQIVPLVLTVFRYTRFGRVACTSSTQPRSRAGSCTKRPSTGQQSLQVRCRPRPERPAPTERHAGARPCGSHHFHRQSSG